MEKQITEMVEDIFQDLCDNYCKFPEQYTDEDVDKLYEEHCDKCPMMR